MKPLLEINASTFDSAATAHNSSGYSVRKASRGVLIGPRKEVYLLYVAKHNYHKLPGGGIDPGEDPESAFVREIKEETGCNASVQRSLGHIIEQRDASKLIQTSYCYIAQQIGERTSAALTQKEIEEGFEVVIADGIDEAIAILKADNPQLLDAKYILHRDLAILKIAKET